MDASTHASTHAAAGPGCPVCGAALAPGAPHGLCPRCLLAGASSPTEPDSASGQRPAPPDLAQVAAAFPQLEILGLIGAGGMGAVFKARQAGLDRLVALKVLPAPLAARPAFVERFHREARLLARLGHPHIVAVHDFGTAGGFPYLLMEFVDGANLRQAMQAGRFTPAQALAVIPQICAALQYAHDRGVLHRDIKPENILLDAAGRVKIADFGIAKLLGPRGADVSLTRTGAQLGTPAYMAPEQIETPAAVDHRADIYSLGVVFYEMLTGELPLGRFAPPSQKTPLDARVDEIVLRALAKERELRQQSAQEVKTQVEEVTASSEGRVATIPDGQTPTPATAARPDPPSPAAPPVEKNPLPLTEESGPARPDAGAGAPASGPASAALPPLLPAPSVPPLWLRLFVLGLVLFEGFARLGLLEGRLLPWLPDDPAKVQPLSALLSGLQMVVAIALAIEVFRPGAVLRILRGLGIKGRPCAPEPGAAGVPCWWELSGILFIMPVFATLLDNLGPMLRLAGILLLQSFARSEAGSGIPDPLLMSGLGLVIPTTPLSTLTGLAILSRSRALRRLAEWVCWAFLIVYLLFMALSIILPMDNLVFHGRKVMPWEEPEWLVVWVARMVGHMLWYLHMLGSPRWQSIPVGHLLRGRQEGWQRPLARTAVGILLLTIAMDSMRPGSSDLSDLSGGTPAPASRTSRWSSETASEVAWANLTGRVSPASASLTLTLHQVSDSELDCAWHVAASQPGHLVVEFDGGLKTTPLAETNGQHAAEVRLTVKPSEEGRQTRVSYAAASPASGEAAGVTSLAVAPTNAVAAVTNSLVRTGTLVRGRTTVLAVIEGRPLKVRLVNRPPTEEAE
jgi:serine/threonine protein kinase